MKFLASLARLRRRRCCCASLNDSNYPSSSFRVLLKYIFFHTFFNDLSFVVYGYNMPVKVMIKTTAEKCAHKRLLLSWVKDEKKFGVVCFGPGQN